jgi:hypothetical protein
LERAFQIVDAAHFCGVVQFLKRFGGHSDYPRGLGEPVPRFRRFLRDYAYRGDSRSQRHKIRLRRFFGSCHQVFLFLLDFVCFFYFAGQ